MFFENSIARARSAEKWIRSLGLAQHLPDMRITAPRLDSLPPTLRHLLSRPSSDGIRTTATVTTVQGWIKSIRAHKNVAFIEVSDGTTSETLQAVLKGKGKSSGDLGLASSVEGILSHRLTIGASVKIHGRLQKSKGKGQACELLVDDLAVLGSCDSRALDL
ncbi:hypothetical protein QFC19_006727 [Naganishia cerealis]|uniref:Uncharacterized protein n=1 Tax=Naganishia cerealis TaxID=610337 RepID=A0ACC2VE35_9TREE|nr:hypothetical protein QFC19_006727 [Naganishia cerealis]